MKPILAMAVPGAIDEILIWLSCWCFGFGLMLLTCVWWSGDKLTLFS